MPDPSGSHADASSDPLKVLRARTEAPGLRLRRMLPFNGCHLHCRPESA